MPDASVLTAADIARLAGVTRGAVSNWRRRHPDFPVPSGGTDASPAYDRSEVEAWLAARGALPELPPAERLWRTILDMAGGTNLGDAVQWAATDRHLLASSTLEIEVPPVVHSKSCWFITGGLLRVRWAASSGARVLSGYRLILVISGAV